MSDRRFPRGGTPHCPHCLEAIGPVTHFCPGCGMPLTAHAAIGPLEQVWALGSLVGRLLSRRPGRFTLLGVWLIAVPQIVVIPALLIHGMTAPSIGAMIGRLIGGAPWLLVATCCALLAVRVTRAYLRPEPTDAS